MNMNIMHTILLWCLFLIVGNPLIGQDLIKATQSGLKITTTNRTNLIAEQVQALKKTETFITESLFSVSASQSRSAYENHVEGAVFLTLNVEDLKNLSATRQDNIVLNIPVSKTKNFQVELMRVNIFSNDFQSKTSSGEIIKTSGLFYRGIVKGNSNSLVSISIYDKHIRGLIADENGNYVLGQIKNRSDSYVLYNDKELKIQNTFSCGVDESIHSQGQGSYGHSGDRSTNGCIDIYIEADYATYQSHGYNHVNVENYMTALFNEVSTLYANESISVLLSGTFVWNSVDPYRNFNDANSVLDEFRMTRTSFNGDLAHFISTRNLGGGVGYLDVLCSAQFSYAVSGGMRTSITPLPTYSWDVYVFAHEMGHNFGSRHTQWCGWSGGPIDNCSTQEDDDSMPCPSCCSPGPSPPNTGGTIMSYCFVIGSIGINLNAGFGPQPGNVIRQGYNSAGCAGSCNDDCPPSLALDHINQGGIYQAENTISSTATISTNLGEVQFKAGEFISLEPGFLADGNQGYFFNTTIEDCGSNLVTRSTKSLIRESLGKQIETIRIAELDNFDSFQISNYPNPFSEESTIELALNKADKVRISLNDVNGKYLGDIMETRLLSEGNYQFSVDGSKYKAGIYYYKVIVGSEHQTGKLILIK